MRKLSILLMLALLLMPAAHAETVTLTDMCEREITLNATATRIVALSAADCEILCALGAGDALVGRGTYCDYPAEIADVPVVDSGYETNIEQIIALAPQVIIMTKMGQTVEQVAALEAAGIAVAVSDAQDIEGVYADIRMIGALTGKTQEAEELEASLRKGFAEISESSRGEAGGTVYFEVSPLEYGLWTAGSNTFMNELCEVTGLTNAFADVDGWGEVSEEQVIKRDPDYIVTITMYFGTGQTPVDEILSRPGWQGMKAVKSGKVFNADSDEISRPGPRLLNAARALYEFVSD